MEKSDAYRKGSGASKKWDGGGPGGPGGGPYGGGPGGPPRRGLDNVRGLDSVRGASHSKFIFSSFLINVIFCNSAFTIWHLLIKNLIEFSDSLPACGSCCG